MRRLTKAHHTLEPCGVRTSEMWHTQREKVRVCASGEVLSVHEVLVQRFKGSKGSEVKRFRGSEVQRFRGGRSKCEDRQTRIESG